ncbi:vacuolar protein sorting-associated protein [Annulohypoxylon truncatum]|uniref:vacuolar protein sorting-associated protein n=1 Tax=Annulohypoxylon truncatum TaxID=327061 RepID=UPI002007724B|nr:vacuolar protein sorting-associated protein [Annulohypoxylon truncatum]KAI1207198.1 vacuolar protein sorting-associated protein [Annulohypoxylon truncatum]
MYNFRRWTIVAVVVGVVVFLATFLPQALNPVPPSKEKREADQAWINTSPHWLDRQACRWFSLCGLLHVRRDPPEKPKHEDDGHELRLELRQVLDEELSVISKGGHKDNKLRGIPDYVLNYAPLVHLYSKEFFWPSDIADHMKHVMPDLGEDKWQQFNNESQPIGLSNLNELSSKLGFVHLNSKDDVESRPEWLHSKNNIPAAFSDEDDEVEGPDDSEPDRRSGEDTTWYEVDRDHPLHRISDPRKLPGGMPKPIGFAKRSRDLKSRQQEQQRLLSQEAQDKLNRLNKPDESGYSRAPATLVLVDKGSGIIDAFWFFFYAYNLGQTVLGTRYGNHVGDWEHCMIRFESGVPRAVFFSEHEGGQAYAWHAVEKRGNETQIQRPVIYSAVGSHAMYATPGNHPYVLPFGMLKDVTDRGPLWDPSKNLRGYWYDYAATKDDEGLEPAKENPDEPTSWFHYKGTWGDKLYGLDDVRQWRLFGQYHYVTGPQGPKFKNLGREKVCQTWRCRIIHSIAEGKKGSWHS